MFDNGYRGLIIALFYGITSASMAFANKAVLSHYNFDYPFFLVTCQMVVAIVLLESLRLTQTTSLVRFSLQRGRDFLMPSIFYAVHSVLSLSALSGMNIPMYGVIKRCSPVVILLLSAVVLKKGMPQTGIILSVGMITSGCLIAGERYGDLAFDPKAYMYGICSVFSQALYLVLVQKHASDQSALETLHLNSYNTLPMLFLCSVTLGEFTQAVNNFNMWDIGFVTTFTIVICVGCLLNYLLFLCTQFNSALTTSITGTVKTIIQTIIGFFTFGGMAVNLFTISGITVNLCGGVIYTYTKYRLAVLRKKQMTMETKVEEGNGLLGNGVTISISNDITNDITNPGYNLAQPHKNM
ncbi:hypothetical protein CAPTEDRAFT_101209 [Capitella teleta]|uniref:Sugar phosphate transporter domain-containing protein n=1 Tax=Capitella teleta TaxID=283909 RepID=R7VDG6_CAPTE|nr:hypothetical protein CAPTEDRAFT_101209 [Capitella teleta]|eukprot:ELU16612.1 hypothetical protein CAPTEDRAFT_101209 [Capitella teleta]